MKWQSVGICAGEDSPIGKKKSKDKGDLLESVLCRQEGVRSRTQMMEVLADLGARRF